MHGETLSWVQYKLHTTFAQILLSSVVGVARDDLSALSVTKQPKDSTGRVTAGSAILHA